MIQALLGEEVSEQSRNTGGATDTSPSEGEHSSGELIG
jgi:hypothetical protein